MSWITTTPGHGPGVWGLATNAGRSPEGVEILTSVIESYCRRLRDCAKPRGNTRCAQPDRRRHVICRVMPNPLILPWPGLMNSLRQLEPGLNGPPSRLHPPPPLIADQRGLERTRLRDAAWPDAPFFAASADFAALAAHPPPPHGISHRFARVTAQLWPQRQSGKSATSVLLRGGHGGRPRRAGPKRASITRDRQSRWAMSKATI